MVERFQILHRRAPGDITVLTALIRDIALNYPGQYEISVDTTCGTLWQNNPYVVPKHKILKGRVRALKACYGYGLRTAQKYEPIHFMSYFHRDFEKQTGIHVDVKYPYPDLHLSAEELNRSPVNGRYWVILPGGKTDFTIKIWESTRFQQLVDRLATYGINCVRLGALGAQRDKVRHINPPLTGVLDLLGKTNLRDMVRLIHHADGVICGVTSAMHMAAALQRPCVVLAGGRESWWWEAYVRENKGLIVPEKLAVPHRYLHTIGMLDCCRQIGCGRNRANPAEPSPCKLPLLASGQYVATCLQMITVDHVLEAVMSYYEDKTLPPIGVVKSTILMPAIVEPAAAPALELTTDLGGPPAGANTQIELTAPAPGSGVQRTFSVRGDILDTPEFGGKVTAFVLLYGPEEYFQLHQRCLDTLIATVPAGRMDLRVGSNELNDVSLAYVERLVAGKLITKHYRHETNDKKYPVMREMFYDPEHPITTKWLLWFDDDSICDRDPHWFFKLAHAINERPEAAMVGAPFYYYLSPPVRTWMQSRAWYRNRPFRTKQGKASAVAGGYSKFCTGGFWALKTEAMRASDIPDAELQHNGGDWTIGEQLYQNGFELLAWNGSKQFVHTSSVPRRGLSEKHVAAQR